MQLGQTSIYVGLSACCKLLQTFCKLDILRPHGFFLYRDLDTYYVLFPCKNQKKDFTITKVCYDLPLKTV